MNSPRSLRSPRKAPQSPRPTINVYKVDSINDAPKRLRLPKSISELLKIATDLLEMQRPAKRALNKEGTAYSDIKEIETESDVYFTCLEEKDDDEEEVVYKSRLPKPSTASKIVLPQVKQLPVPERRLDAYQHQALASSSSAVKENLRDALLALYESLPEEAKVQVDLSKLLQETQLHEIVDELYSKQISAPTSNLLHLGLSKLKNKTPEECRFVVTGPTESGKSTILGYLATLFYEKLQISSTTREHLIFIMNWRLIQVETISELFEIIVKQTIAAVRNSCKEFIPILSSLEQYLLSINKPVFLQIPPCVLHFPNFPIPALQILCESMHNKKDKLDEFIPSIASFPRNFSSVLGFRDCVHIYDHFDLCPSSSSDISIVAAFSQAVSTGPFFVSSTNDTDLFKVFNPAQYEEIVTERVLEPEAKSLIIKEPAFQIDQSMCRGCPGFVAKFNHLYDLVGNSSKSTKTQIKTVIDQTNTFMIHSELMRLCQLLRDGGESRIDGNVLLSISHVNDIDVRVH